MIINKNIKKFKALSLVITICVSIISCDNENYLYNNDLYNNNAVNENEAINERVQTNIEEAKILSDVSILNENIIVLSNSLLEKNSIYPLKNISHKLNKDHIQIRKNINDLAKKKLVLLPTTLDKNEINEISKIDEARFPKDYLDEVKKLLENEIEQTEYLSMITNDVDFKVLTIKILVKLNYNLIQIHKTLNQIINN
ncbi:hypothetical protein QLS71_003930 [Mariniflexile litorale]|uniref:DUF4142 domain-containing protein n=1 Tax=Mariniflexile litorale TaxID=3045158 RepID=A0AAU7EII8_9FLAO|nr:hypothetical protein [Mariniflexile sp. KMM 9835]MDQ8210169.1 hypothetical protein [Mariniflexile sp. KMM 9835]